MDQETFLERVKDLRRQGASIQSIASELGVDPSRVRWALRALNEEAGAQAGPPVDRRTSQDTQRETSFIGRRREMGELTAALEDALSGRGSLALLVGEPGIGKTRTAQEIASLAASRGALVLWGRCHPTLGAPAYWPWVQAIRAYAQQCTPEELRSHLGAGAADVSEVVPEVKERLPDLGPPPVLEPQQSRFRLFDSVSAFFMRASHYQPLVVVLDNIHWADQPSLLLMEFLVQELADCRLLVVGTYRDTEMTRRHPLSRALGELAREPSFRRLLLRGLNQDEVSDFIQGTSGFRPPAELARAVHAQTEGNPLFVTEVVRLLAQEGVLASAPVGIPQDWSIMIPVGVREVIGRRLERLSEECNQVLSLASIIGREFDLGLLEHLLSEPVSGVSGALSGDEILEAVEEALAARVIEEVPQTATRYQFSHVLIQDTLARELSAARRARLHRRIAEALERIGGPDPVGLAAELAYHFAQAATATDTGKLARYSLLAGEQALANYAHEEALVHFERGLEAKEGQPTDAETAGLWFGLGRAQATTRERFDFGESLSSLQKAFDYYFAAGDVDRAVAVAEYPVLTALGVTVGSTELITQALALTPLEPHQTGRLLSTYGLSFYQETGDYGAAQEAFQGALEVAAREGDAVLELRTLGNATNVDFHHLRWEKLLQRGARAIELSRTADEPQAEVAARLYVMRTLGYLGNPRRARQQMTAMLQATERLRHRSWLGNIIQCFGNVGQFEGNWSEARSFMDRALSLEPHEPRHLCIRAVLEHHAGDFSQGESYMERLLEVVYRSPLGAGFA